MWLKNTCLFDYNIATFNVPAEGDYIRHHGTAYRVTGSSTCYSVNIDSFDVDLQVEEVPIFAMIFPASERGFADDLAKELSLSESALARSAIKLKWRAQELYKNDPEKYKELTRLLSQDLGPGGCGAGE